MSKRFLFFVVLVLSAMTLQLELLQTRIFSVVLWHHFVYIVITMALLGFAASGTALAVSRRLKAMGDSDFFSFCLAGFSLSSFIITRFVSLPIWNLFALEPNLKIVLSLIVAYTVSMIPYFFAGLAIAGAFIRFPKMTGVLYFGNLLGSGLGCILFVFLIGYMGGPHLLLFGSFVSMIPLVFLAKNRKRLEVFVFLWTLALVVLFFFPETSKIKRMLPESHKQYWTVFGKDTELEFSMWNPISRIDVITSKKLPMDRRILMDGDAMAQLFTRDSVRHFMEKVRPMQDRRAAYALLKRRPERTLVIGAGGGFDVWEAKLSGSRFVDAVEINPATAYITSVLYADWIDHLYARPDVHLFVEDGRSFVRRTKNKYDVIVMHATDSLLALSTGSYVLCDNYLYTREALEDYLGHLSDDGMLHISRWFFMKKPRETLRIFSTALEACRRLGYKDPLAHIAVIMADKEWGNVIVKKKPFTDEEKEILGIFCSQAGITPLFPAGLPKAPVAPEGSGPFLELAEKFSLGKEKEFYRDYFYNVEPVTDDSPFFYQFDKWKHPRAQKGFQDKYYDKIRGVWHIFILSSLMVHAAVLSFVFVLLPLVISKKRLGGAKVCLFTFIYFSSIGLAFMFLEMGIVQKFVLFLGSPIYSMAVVIPTVLIGAGLGSLCSARILGKVKIGAAAAVSVSSLLILLLASVLPSISGMFLAHALPVRIMVAILAIAPLAFFMGFPFPLGLRLISAHSTESVPWAWAINGSASVLASVLAIVVAMRYGFQMVLTLSALFYLSALVSFVFLYQKRVKA